MLRAMRAVHAFQILSHYTRPEDLDPGFGWPSVTTTRSMSRCVATWLLITNGSFNAEIRDPFAACSRIYKLPLAIVSYWTKTPT